MESFCINEVIPLQASTLRRLLFSSRQIPLQQRGQTHFNLICTDAWIIRIIAVGSKSACKQCCY